MSVDMGQGMNLKLGRIFPGKFMIEGGAVQKMKQDPALLFYD